MIFISFTGVCKVTYMTLINQIIFLILIWIVTIFQSLFHLKTVSFKCAIWEMWRIFASGVNLFISTFFELHVAWVKHFVHLRIINNLSSWFKISWCQRLVSIMLLYFLLKIQSRLITSIYRSSHHHPRSLVYLRNKLLIYFFDALSLLNSGIKLKSILWTIQIEFYTFLLRLALFRSHTHLCCTLP